MGLSKASSFKMLYSNIYLNLQLFASLHLRERGEGARSRRAYANVLRTMLFLIFISVTFLNALSPGILLPCMHDRCILLGVSSKSARQYFLMWRVHVAENGRFTRCRERGHFPVAERMLFQCKWTYTAFTTALLKKCHRNFFF